MKRNLWIAIFAMPTIAALLMLAGSPSVMANDQPSTEVKIDSSSLGRRR
jgi:hypothetical protein